MNKAKEKSVARHSSARRRETLAAYAFLAPNFLGFLLFTSVPVVISLFMSFTHWNIFKSPTWLGFENFRSLLGFHHEGARLAPNDPFFWQYVYNTVYLMIGIPIGMMGSLLVALMMNQKLKGIVVFRTIYFLPAVCSGVALLILWKYLYNSDIGLINQTVRSIGGALYANPVTGVLTTAVLAIIFGLLTLGSAAAILLLVFYICTRLGIRLRDGLYRIIMIATGAGLFIAIGAFGGAIHSAILSFISTPPDWLGTVQWAKPALIVMGLWGGLGGYNMILYLAALQGVPSSYYEAAEIDGAGPWAKFWSVTWPMISPTTFFILVMSIIGGFQSGFMTANVMTGGGPAGSTTTIEYYLYQTAFEKFNMGYASTIAWVLFGVILVLTLATWKLGGRVVSYE